MNNKTLWLQRRRRLFEILEAGSAEDPVSRIYDVFSTFMTLANVLATLLYTFDEMELAYGRMLLTMEAATVAFFAVEYVLRVWTASGDYWKVYFAMNEKVRYTFRDYGIEMTYPHLNIHLDK